MIRPVAVENENSCQVLDIVLKVPPAKLYRTVNKDLLIFLEMAAT